MNLQIIDTSSVSVTGLTERMRRASLSRTNFYSSQSILPVESWKTIRLLCKKIQVFSGKSMFGYLSFYTI